MLASEPATAAKATAKALDGIGEVVQAKDKRERTVRTDLVLLVDQLDELFSPSLRAEARELLRARARSPGRHRPRLGRGYAPSRSLLRHAGSAGPEGAQGRRGRIRPRAAGRGGAGGDRAPAGRRPPTSPSDRTLRPARASTSGCSARPTGPTCCRWCSSALARLYEGRIQDDGRTVLPFAVFSGLGGLTGIIDEVGEQALAALPPEDAAGLPPLVRGLAQL